MEKWDLGRQETKKTMRKTRSFRINSFKESLAKSVIILMRNF